MAQQSSVEILQENATAFFNSVSLKHSQTYVCRKGCSQCCHSQFSIFISEAELIKHWFHELPNKEKQKIKKLWTNSKDNRGACAFLVDGQCSIYPVRPIICRTQGLPLYLKSIHQFDICPLNNVEENLNDKNDWLDLERLNTLLALTCPEGERIQLLELRGELLSW